MSAKSELRPLEPRALPIEVKRALVRRKPSADSAQLLTDLIDVWGGTRKLAVDLHTEFKHAQKGGMTRQRILEMIQRLVVINTQHEIGQSRSPSSMTDEELLAAAAEYYARLNQKPEDNADSTVSG